jgi:hypothetical protein
MRKPRVAEQPIAERQLPRILDRQNSGRHDRILVGVGLTLPLLRHRPASAKGQDDQDQARHITAGPGADHHQLQAVARGGHDEFTVW